MTGSMTAKEWRHARTLAGVYASRLRRPYLSMGGAVLVLVMIDVSRHGVRFDDLLPWVLGGAMVMPFAPGFTLVREKTDGSLRYFASLPVTGRAHSLARLLVSAVTALPGALLAAVALAMRLESSVQVAVAAGAAIWAALTAASLGLLALSLRAKVGQAMVFAIYAIVGSMAVMRALAFAKERGWLEPLRAMIANPAGLAALSGLVWVAIAIAGFVALKSISNNTSAYRGEVAEV
jgi:hypothetical protein